MYTQYYIGQNKLTFRINWCLYVHIHTHTQRGKEGTFID